MKTVTWQEGKTIVESDQCVVVFHQHLDREQAIEKAKEYEIPKPVKEQPKATKRGAHMKAYWEYRKKGGILSMAEFIKSNKEGSKGNYVSL